MRLAILRSIILAWFACLSILEAHEIRPAYLQVDETAPGSYDVLWKVPRIGDQAVDIHPEFDHQFNMSAGPGGALLDGFVVYHYQLRGTLALEGTRLAIRDLPRTTIDVLVNLNLREDRKHTFLLHPTSSEIAIPQTPGRMNVAVTYAKLGIEHILLGIDHLLFVLALVLLVKGRKRLVGTITAFTLAHSLTLAVATLGFVHVPGPPVEACIALSIVFVAAEIVHGRQGKPGLTARAPWVVAFTFGLLHGLGFAGALSEVGLPQNAIPLALLFFNVGVELGQLAFIAAVLALIATGRRLPMRVPNWSWQVAPYSIGAVAMFWVIQRLVAF